MCSEQARALSLGRRLAALAARAPEALGWLAGAQGCRPPRPPKPPSRWPRAADHRRSPRTGRAPTPSRRSRAASSTATRPKVRELPLCRAQVLRFTPATAAPNAQLLQAPRQAAAKARLARAGDSLACTRCLSITATPAALARSLRSIPRFSCLPVWGARAQARAWRADRVPSVAVPAAKGRHGRCRALKMRARPAALLRGVMGVGLSLAGCGAVACSRGVGPCALPLGRRA